MVDYESFIKSQLPRRNQLEGRLRHRFGHVTLLKFGRRTLRSPPSGLYPPLSPQKGWNAPNEVERPHSGADTLQNHTRVTLQISPLENYTKCLGNSPPKKRPEMRVGHLWRSNCESGPLREVHLSRHEWPTRMGHTHLKHVLVISRLFQRATKAIKPDGKLTAEY